VDATLIRQNKWHAAGRSRTAWVALQGIGAPFGVGFLATVAYVAKIRREVTRASASVSAADEAVVEAETAMG
jgi:hypothetical protein